ncbi:hypothetical protein AGDE_06961 [Angomonas deanei]|nr:hypothetical protein AGDE_06961 [Angomonas deanei]|eukprot:EPY36342.1 hypothetical protein AGDE_06961 [Angomonas deanei]
MAPLWLFYCGGTLLSHFSLRRRSSKHFFTFRRGRVQHCGLVRPKGHSHCGASGGVVCAAVRRHQVVCQCVLGTGRQREKDVHLFLFLVACHRFLRRRRAPPPAVSHDTAVPPLAGVADGGTSRLALPNAPPRGGACAPLARLFPGRLRRLHLVHVALEENVAPPPAAPQRASPRGGGGDRLLARRHPSPPPVLHGGEWADRSRPADVGAATDGPFGSGTTPEVGGRIRAARLEGRCGTYSLPTRDVPPSGPLRRRLRALTPTVYCVRDGAGD